VTSVKPTVTVTPAPTLITSATSTTFTVGTAASFTVTAAGYPLPTLGESGALPNGVTFSAATGLLGGLPSVGAAGDYSLTFTASSGMGMAVSQSFTLIVMKATPTISVSDAGGTFDGGPFPAAATIAGVLPGVDDRPSSSLEGVSPTLTYYAGSSPSGSPLAGAPSAPGTYTVLASFAGSADYGAASASATFTIANPPPVTVTSFSLETVRVGRGRRRKKETVLVLQFSAPLDPAAAQNLDAYQVLAGKARRKAGATFKKPVPLASAVYNSSTLTVTLIPGKRLNLSQPEQLRITAALLTDSLGRPLDGGLDFVANFNKQGTTILARRGASAIPTLSGTAVDSLFESTASTAADPWR
jgi:hypothetical protein